MLVPYFLYRLILSTIKVYLYPYNFEEIAFLVSSLYNIDIIYILKIIDQIEIKKKKFYVWKSNVNEKKMIFNINKYI